LCGHILTDALKLSSFTDDSDADELSEEQLLELLEEKLGAA
jgi:hypothetical protein